jgi:hypothetical protein
MDYCHSALPSPDYFRLLSLRPGQRNDDICCHVETFHIHSEHCPLLCLVADLQVPSYEALSYHWGNDKPTSSITILAENKVPQAFHIRPNLEAALRQLRLPDKPRALWIDAICIDQSDNDEKSLQIPKMAEIFANAIKVCIWIGEESDGSALALRFVKSRLLDLGQLDKLVCDEQADIEWAAVSKLMRRPWFSRRWVIQEIALAQEAVLYVGEETISWLDFADAIALFASYETQSRIISRTLKSSKVFGHTPDFFGDAQALGATRLVEATSSLFRKSDTGNIQERLLSLEYLVCSFCTFKASMPHDTIYAVLALAKDAAVTVNQKLKTKSAPDSPADRDNLATYLMEIDKNDSTLKLVNTESVESSAIVSSKQDPASNRLESPVPSPPHPKAQVSSQRFEVDYSTRFDLVCRKFVQSIVRTSKSLDIICRAWAPDGEDLPTWIPTLKRATFGLHPDEHYSRINADSLVGLPGVGKRCYNASGSTPLNLSNDALASFMQGSVLDKSMFVKGFILDSVDLKDMPALEGIIPSSWLEFGGWIDTSSPPPDQLWRTLVADRGPDGSNPPSYYPRAFKHVLLQCVAGGALNTEQLIAKGDSSIVAQFLRRVQSVIWMRRLIRTKDENFLGLAPPNTKKGDLICILYGCSVPVVLRKAHNQQKRGCRTCIQKKVICDMKKPRCGQCRKASYTFCSQRPCHRCRNRKTRCDFGEPRCGPCTRTNSNCRQEPGIETKDFGEGSGLKTADGYFELVGECYIHGMMDGEAIGLRVERNMIEHTFQLR